MSAQKHTDELTRRRMFPHIAFRQSPLGRQAYLRSVGLKVWSVAITARDFDGDADLVAEHFEVNPTLIREALDYADAFPDEIQAFIDYADAFDFETLRAILPNATPSRGE